jgi:protein tyrosine phosphatase (PTP) superfamily phosphohydrolase (DUF442 family)
MAVLSPTPRARSLLDMMLRGCVVGLLLAIGLHFGYVLLGSNFRTVVDKQVYRCAQPSPGQLEAIITKYGIRTVINLRGCCVTAPWYIEQARTCAEYDVSLEDLGFSAVRLPSTVALRQLVEVLDRSEYPILLHCHQGADRTGLAAVVYFLLQPGIHLSEARRHLGVRSGHVALGRTRYIDRFFRLYERWLLSRGREHSPGTFRLWVRDHYCPGEGRAEFTLLDPVPKRNATGTLALKLPAEEARMLQMRCKNTSITTWRMQPGLNAGVHGIWLLYDTGASGLLVAYGRVGLFERAVAPGEHVDLSIPLPPLEAGHYELRFDLLNPPHGSFLQLGNDLLLVDVEVM